ncbi:phosphotransferase [Streptomyces sp. DSM 44915]|uniref:Phosphotransferase n=1 Tax=Streptomyces chisholmiae TaxID=3075540 RepID=A0ABU2JR13_9ACTN|nr:phosphotransferase [Streptomyces sp. DSM 44915]MDT0267193.1 phosphotransferase [Streptomyces sp. DSM 44915]
MRPETRLGEPLAAGRTADIYPLPGARVLRRYRGALDARPEGRLLARLGRLGYPVPRVYPDAGPGVELGPGDLVLERLHGPTLAAAVLSGAVTPERTGAILARLLDQLHALPGGLVHLDLHPENVLCTAGGPVVIDWANAGEGRPPGHDRALSAVILAEAAVGPFPLGGQVLTALLRELTRDGRPAFDAAELHWAAELRRANPTLSEAEKVALADALKLITEATGNNPAR